jgi:DNA gyrase subunit A
MRGGIIAIKLREDDELVDAAIAKKGDEIVLSTARGMAIRFSEADARPMGRNTSGVKGISLGKDDRLVGMVVAESEATLLTACLNGYGKRTRFGPNSPLLPSANNGSELEDDTGEEASAVDEPTPIEEPSVLEGEEGVSSSNRYRTQRRGGKGLRDIKTTERNGPVISVASVTDEDELLMMTARGKLQRIVASEVSVIGRNTQGVKIMGLDEGDTLAAVVCVPRIEAGNGPSVIPLETGGSKPPSASSLPDAAPGVDEADPDAE